VATKDHPTLFATGLVDLKRRIVIDVVPGNSASDLGSWLDRRPASWLAGVRVVATDLAESYRAGLDGRLAHAIRVADPFHVTRLANRCLDQVRRRVQNQTLGHRGRKADPLYRIRKLMVTGAERLDERGLDRMLLGIRLGDPEDEVFGAWLAKESVCVFKPAAKAAGIPELTFHDLRHTGASLMIAAGCHVKVIADQMGHSDGGGLVLKRYGHPYKGARLQAATELEAHVFGPAPDRPVGRTWDERQMGLDLDAP
jgi:hypothetical protein